MSNAATSTNNTDSGKPAAPAPQDAPIDEKGKGRPQDDAMDEDDDDDDDEDDEEEEIDEEVEEDDMEEEEELAEIDPQAILPTGRRTRGVKIDYSSAEAHEKAGLEGVDADEDDDEEHKA